MNGWSVSLLFATSGSDKGVPSGMTLARDGTFEMLREGQCASKGASALHVRHIETLSDDHLCSKLVVLSTKFTTGSSLASELAGFLEALRIGTRDQLARDIDQWRAQCGIQAKP